MRSFQNADVHTRIWPHLTNARTGKTLELAPGEKAHVDLPDDFTDAHLVPVPKSRPEVKARAEKPPVDGDPKPTEEN